jgi:hypothetical protein
LLVISSWLALPLTLLPWVQGVGYL